MNANHTANGFQKLNEMEKAELTVLLRGLYAALNPATGKAIAAAEIDGVRFEKEEVAPMVKRVLAELKGR